MKKSRRFIVCFYLLSAVPLMALDSSVIARQKYDALKIRAMSGDTTVDWQELRLSAQVAGVNGGFDWREANKKAMAAFASKDYAAMLKYAREITEHNIANPDGHFAAMVAYKYLGQPEKQAKEKGFVDAIVKSIVNSGDGKSAKTAYFAVTTSEEYFMLQILGYRPKTQALAHVDGHDFDDMTVLGDGNKEYELWFNTDTDMQIMAQGLGIASAKK